MVKVLPCSLLWSKLFFRIFICLLCGLYLSPTYLLRENGVTIQVKSIVGIYFDWFSNLFTFHKWVKFFNCRHLQPKRDVCLKYDKEIDLKFLFCFRSVKTISGVQLDTLGNKDWCISKFSIFVIYKCYQHSSTCSSIQLRCQMWKSLKN